MSLPSGYIQVEYIESSGTQYIDTGYKPNQDTRLVLDVYSFYEGSDYKVLFGARPSANNDAFGMWLDDTGIYPNYGDGTVTAYHINVHPAQRLSVDMNKSLVTVNGVSVAASTSSFSSQYPLFLMSYNTAGTADSRMAKARIYSCQIYDNGTLVRDFEPCVNPSGEVGMYDLVNAVFYGSSGTGAFTAGSPLTEEYTDITPVMTSANTPAGYAVTASSTHTISQPWMAFDGITSSTSNAWRVWHSQPGVPQWIMLEFPEAVEVSAFSITNRANFGDYDTKGILSFSLEGSNNGTSFVTLGTYTRAGDYALTTVHPVGTPGEYRYYRIYVTQCGYVYSGSQYAVVEEIRFYETAKTVPDAPEELTAAYASGTVTLTWTAAEDAAGYRIYADGVPIGDTAETSFTYTGVEMYGVYIYTVTAYNEYGEGDGASVRVQIPGSSDVLADLITDRTAEDIWNRTAKGVYNARDLNRVSTAAAYVRSMLAEYGYLCGADARADWKANEIPRTSAMQAHHLSVTALDVIRYAHDPVKLPVSLEKLTWEDANAIEAFLLSCGRAAERIPESWVFAGECICGEI